MIGDPSGRMRADWAQARRYADSAAKANRLLCMFAKTAFHVGDICWFESRERVRITAVHPRGYITAPSTRSNLGGWLAPVVCREDIYQFQALDRDQWRGQAPAHKLYCDAQSMHTVSATSSGSRQPTQA